MTRKRRRIIIRTDNNLRDIDNVNIQKASVLVKLKYSQ